MRKMQLVCVQDFEEHAKTVLPKLILNYYLNGAGRETTLKNNRNAFQRIRIRPRCLMDVSQRDLSATILGEKLEIPVGIAPTALQKLAHPDGEIANVLAAQNTGSIFILSFLSTVTIEEVAEAAPKAIKWFQVYIDRNREITINLIRRAEKAGFKAIVVTVDTPLSGIRYADIRNHFKLPSHLKVANFQANNTHKISETGEQVSGLQNYLNASYDPSITWKDIEWLMSVTKLPIVLKGVLAKEDALMAENLGVSGIIVSNHGGRQLDSTPASIEALPVITRALKGRMEVYLDGGVTDGTDVFKALAFGAKMVFVGRPVLWGLVHSAYDGVKHVLDIFKTDLDTTMAIAGCRNLKEITRDRVALVSEYSKL